MNAQELIKTLEWRYATKIFNPNRRIPEADWNALLESLHLSPSSLGLQMWKFIDVREPSVRAELRSVSWDQPQVTDSSHLVVFCARRDFSTEDVQRYLERIVEVRGVTMESLNLYRDRIVELAGSKSPDVLKAWLERQVYIALGFMMSCAANLRIDTCALE
ncbi:nitroreductase family protein, partial [Bacteroides caccae]|uniref:nitroreductase family protein n=3 Tax=Pseudomonadati TaxID=3379134 RepID=UPI001230281B